MASAGRLDTFLGLVLPLVLFVSGVIEGFVTPPGLPTWARIPIGVAAEPAFLAYVYGLGGRAAQAVDTGDVDTSDWSSRLPAAA